MDSLDDHKTLQFHFNNYNRLQKNYRTIKINVFSFGKVIKTKFLEYFELISQKNIITKEHSPLINHSLHLSLHQYLKTFPNKNLNFCNINH